ncbi:MAG: class I SAM-dependent methyltransferase [Planctomycetota bacterium]
MARSTNAMIDRAVDAAEDLMLRQDKVWSKFSNDKVDIGEALARVLRRLHAALPVTRPLRALSIGSSNEPQFRILQAFCQGGLHLMDIEPEALAAVAERVARQRTRNVHTIAVDYTRVLLDGARAARFRARTLGGKRVELITLHHSMYYCREASWRALIANLCTELLARRGAIHAVLMAARSDNRDSTTWLYNHFAGEFCGHHNTQDLRVLARQLRSDPRLASVRVGLRTSVVQFAVPDFDALMAVVWMILLYPQVHDYTRAQRLTVARHVHRRFFRAARPLVQEQDHLVIYRGV